MNRWEMASQSWFCSWMQHRARKGNDPAAEGHLAECPACREATTAYREMGDRLRAHPDLFPAASPPSDLWERVSAGIEQRRPAPLYRQPVWIATAAATASLALGFILAIPNDPPEQVARMDTTAPQSQSGSAASVPSVVAPQRGIDAETSGADAEAVAPEPSGGDAPSTSGANGADDTPVSPLSPSIAQTPAPAEPPVRRVPSGGAPPPTRPDRRRMARLELLNTPEEILRSRFGDTPPSAPATRPDRPSSAPLIAPPPEAKTGNTSLYVKERESVLPAQPKTDEPRLLDSSPSAYGAAPPPPAAILPPSKPVGPEPPGAPAPSPMARSRTERAVGSPLAQNAAGASGRGGSAAPENRSGDPSKAVRRGNEPPPPASQELNSAPAIRAVEGTKEAAALQKNKASRPGAAAAGAKKAASRDQAREKPLREEIQNRQHYYRQDDVEDKGHAAFKRGRWREAIRAYRLIHSPSAGVLLRIGQAHLQLNERGAARRAFEESLKRDPHYLPAQRALENLK